MLVLNTPEQVASKWPLFQPLIIQALPPTVQADSVLSVNILRAVLSEELKVWTMFWPDGPEGAAVAVLTTTEDVDRISGQRRLLIYTMAAVGEITDFGIWRSAIGTLLKYAEGIGCLSVSAYTSHTGMKAMLVRLGGEADYSFIHVDIAG